MLLAANHPNSWLDGVILSTLFEENIYSLARGDAFKKRWHAKFLKKIHQFPVYRTSEGVENLEHNYTTFAACQEVFASGGIVLIFSEGRCMNEWKLRPLKKGTARLAISTWQKKIKLTVMPVGLNYNQFRNFGKNVFINFGEPLNKGEILQHQSDGKLLLSFNEQLEEQLKRLVYNIGKDDVEKQRKLLTVPSPLWKQVVLAVPALIGFLVHAPAYFAARGLTKKIFDNDHFDSAVASMVVLFYPFYLLLVFLIIHHYFNWKPALITILLMPFTAWAAVQLKKQY